MFKNKESLYWFIFKVGILTISGFLFFIGHHFLNSEENTPSLLSQMTRPDPLSREEQILKLEQEQFDIVIIGGGVTGATTALEASSRGLKVALIEKSDFGSGFSSKGSKLLQTERALFSHVYSIDAQKVQCFKTLMEEKAKFINSAPYMMKALPIMVPAYSYIDLGRLWVWEQILNKVTPKESPAELLSSKKAHQMIPLLNTQSLKGGLLFYENLFNDARFNIVVLVTASEAGACIGNYIKATGLSKQDDIINGVEARDLISGKEFLIKGKIVINATGADIDHIRKIDSPYIHSNIKYYDSLHLLIDQHTLPPQVGLMLPEKNGTDLFTFYNWLGYTTVSYTTNTSTKEVKQRNSVAQFKELLKITDQYLTQPIEADHIVSYWKNRQLVLNSDTDPFSFFPENHIITSPSKLISLLSVTWISVRPLAEEAVNQAISQGRLKVKNPSLGSFPALAGSEYSPSNVLDVLQNNFYLDEDIAEHLVQSYGGRALTVAELARKGFFKRLIPKYPYIEAEVLYATQYEHAQSALDFLNRRTSMGYVNPIAAQLALPRVIELMSKELEWSQTKAEKELIFSQQQLENCKENFK